MVWKFDRFKLHFFLIVAFLVLFGVIYSFWAISNKCIMWFFTASDHQQWAMMKHTLLMAMLATLYLYGSTYAEDVKTMYYKPAKDVTCTAYELQSNIHRQVTPVSCSLLCLQSNSVCFGFRYSDAKCELCNGCPASSNVTSFNSTGGLYTTSLGSWDLDLEEGKYKYFPKAYKAPCTVSFTCSVQNA